MLKFIQYGVGHSRWGTHLLVICVKSRSETMKYGQKMNFASKTVC
jgi:hypothetical protein